MALKPIHCIVLAAGACAAFAAAMLPPHEFVAAFSYSSRTKPLTFARDRAWTEARMAVRDLQDVILRDSVAAFVSSLPQSERARPQIIVDPAIPLNARALAQRLLLRAWNRLEIDSTRVPVAIVLVRAVSGGADSAYLPGHGRGYVIPLDSANPIEPCISILRVQGDTTVTTEYVSKALTYGWSGYYQDTNYGPCPFYARFGRPGARIQKWLEQQGFHAAVNAGWNAEPSATRMNSNSILQGGDYRFTSLAGRSCWLGDTSKCPGTILGPLERPGAPKRLAGFYTFGAVVDSHFDDMTFTFLAEMVRKFGPEKFETFWASNKDPAVAFQNATGTGIGEYVHEWVNWKWGHTVSGAKVPAGNIGWGLAIAIGCLSAAAVVAGRRTVG